MPVDLLRPAEPREAAACTAISDGARLAAFIRYDWINQTRQNMVAATVLSTLALCGVVLLAGDALTPGAAALLIFIDPASVGLGFVGAAVFLERATGVLLALGATPARPALYVISKCAVFCAIGVGSGMIVAAVITDFWRDGPGGAAGPLPGAAAILFATLILANAAATLFGLGLACGAPSMNAFLLRSGLASIALAPPIVAQAALGPGALAHPLHWLFPSAPFAHLLAVGVGEPVSMATAAAGLGALFWTVLAAAFALHGVSAAFTGTAGAKGNRRG
ncbi:MAG: hypothetical protein AAF909_13915 [Pseudomonadota bacterium]